jgi:hypothetical protein
LQRVHSSRLRRCLVIEAVQVQETMQQIEFDFALGCGPKSCAVTLRGLRADKYFAVLKRNDIGRARDFLETLVQIRDFSVRNQKDIDDS